MSFDWNIGPSIEWAVLSAGIVAFIAFQFGRVWEVFQDHRSKTQVIDVEDIEERLERLEARQP